MSKSSRWSEYRLSRRVQYHEVDAAGIVHFSSFFRYMEEAEHALWRAAGLSIAAADSTIGWPRVAAAFDYHQPLHFEEEFVVTIRIVAIRARTMSYECVLTRGDTRIATGALTIACVGREAGQPMKATAIPQEILARFEASPEPFAADVRKR